MDAAAPGFSFEFAPRRDSMTSVARNKTTMAQMMNLNWSSEIIRHHPAAVPHAGNDESFPQGHPNIVLYS